MGVRKQLRVRVFQRRSLDLNRFIAHLSHKIFKTHGLRGHLVRQGIRRNLKNYAYSLSRKQGIMDNREANYAGHPSYCTCVACCDRRLRKDRKGHSKKGGNPMLRLPIKFAWTLASLLSVVLGVHGIWVYFSRLELLFGAEPAKLFLVMEIPIRLRPMIEWMSVKGIQSWVIPAGFIVLGIILWGWQSRIHSNRISLPRWLW